MSVIDLGTKAETLHRLRPKLCRAQVKPLISFTIAEWQASSDALLSRVHTELTGDRFAVRSSACNEDSSEESLAGEFESILNVPRDPESLRTAIVRVISSYHDDNPSHQVIVQEQVESIAMSGVVFTRDLDTGAPYYTVNYDDHSGSSSSVTSGTGANLKTLVRFRNAPLRGLSYQLKVLFESLAEIEQLTANDALDIEFAIDHGMQLFILQVRPIAAIKQRTNVADETVAVNLQALDSRLATLDCAYPGICGKRAIYSVMTDWNPAEIIGIRPKQLALSLYKELVTDSIWAYQRDNYGYRNLRSFPLLHSFLGIPYIDVRASFNSFVPKSIDDSLAQKLVDYYIKSLLDSPRDHDKVEFNIIYSCYYLDLPLQLKRLLNFGFREIELDRIKFALLNLTNGIIAQRDGHYKRDLQRIQLLEERYDAVVSSHLPDTDQVYWLIEECKRYGTLPFAGLARAGFIAVQFLRSFVACGIMSEDDYGAFMRSLNTVAKRLAHDTGKLNAGDLSEEDFLATYGHLRPGTYDITSPRYDAAFERYFEKGNSAAAPSHEAEFTFSPAQHEAISAKLIENGLIITADQLLVFLREAIEGREYSKFLFSKLVSQTLAIVERIGETKGIPLEEVAHLDIHTLLSRFSTVAHEDLGAVMRRDIAANKERHRVAEAIRLPQLIAERSDIYHFYLGSVEPNFVTRSAVTSIVVLERDFPHVDLSSKIVFIESADPGYDWLFSRNIAGLITLYGGANSHMAIRCAELSIPAVIGCGEQNFGNWSKSKKLEIDCANRLVRVLQ